jgi:hypothetical protein
LAVGKRGYPSAKVARYLGVTTSSVNRLAVSEEAADLKKYLKMLQTLRPISHMFPGKLLWHFAVSLCRAGRAIEIDMIKLYNDVKLS